MIHRKGTISACLCACIGLLAALWTTGVVLAQARACEGVVLDDIQVYGVSKDKHLNISNHFELSPGTCLSLEHLDESITRGRERLEASGAFSSVDISLVRGIKRAHYRAVVSLTPIAAYYAGAGNRLAWAENSYFEHPFRTYHRAQTHRAFVGSRDFLDTGLKLDIEGQYVEEQGRTRYDGTFTDEGEDYSSEFSYRGNPKSTGQNMNLNIFHPSLSGSNYVAGLSLYRQYARTNDRSTSHNVIHRSGEDSQVYASESFSRSINLNGAATFKLGRRFANLTLVSLLSRDVNSWQQSQKDRETGEAAYNDKEVTWGTHIGMQAVWSDQANLSLIDPGYYFKATYQREVAPKKKAYTASGDLEYTFRWRSWALSPAASVLWSGWEQDDQLEFWRSSRYSLEGQWALNQEMILSLAGGATMWTAQGQSFISPFFRFLELKAHYILPTFSYEFALLLGHKFEFLENDQRRVAE